MQPRSAAVGFPKEPHYKLLWFRLWLGNSTPALMPRPPRPTPQCSRLSQSDSVSRIASLLSSQCLPLPFVIAGNYLSKGGSFLYWGFLQSCSAASSDKREAPAPGSLSRIHVLVCSLHSRQLPGPGRRPNKSPAPSSLRVSRYFAWHSHSKQTGQQSSSVSSRPLSGKCGNLEPLTHTLETVLPPDLALPNLPS